MLDVAGAVATHLRADAALMLALDGRVFAEKVPPESVAPFVFVRMGNSDQPFVDVETWEAVSVLIDVVGDPEDIPALHDIATLTRTSVQSMRGAVASDLAFQAVGPFAAAFGFDPSFTPALPRWVLTAPMVVRGITTTEGVVA